MKPEYRNECDKMGSNPYGGAGLGCLYFAIVLVLVAVIVVMLMAAFGPAFIMGLRF